MNKKDVGSSEAQINILSEKINYLTEHFKKKIWKNPKRNHWF